MAKIIGNTIATPMIPPNISSIEAEFKRTKYYGDADIVPTDSSLFNYTLNDDGQSYTIRANGDSLSGGIVIPYEYNGLPITTIGDSAFTICTNLTSITIPKSVTTIGDYVFWLCSGLTSITIPDSVTSIGEGAFAGCDGLTSITIPDSVTSIGEGAFLGCSGLTSITIPDSVTTIGNNTFKNCTNLTSITIPNSVTSIGGSAFYNCKALNDVYYEGTKEQWDAITIKATGNEALFVANIHYDWTPLMKGELSDTYVQKEDIGDRSKLIYNPNDDIVTAINNAWNNAESANMNANTALMDAGTAMGIAETAASIAKGANQALTFTDYSSVIKTLNDAEADVYNAGQNFYVIDTDVPDLWISENVDTPKRYEYTTDEAFIEELITNGKVTIGWYAVSMLEAQKVDLTNCATKEEVQKVDDRLGDIIIGAQIVHTAQNANRAVFDGDNNEITLHYATKTEVGEIDALKRITYYGDARTIPSDESLFNFRLMESGDGYYVSAAWNSDDTSVTRIVIPYQYDGKAVKHIDAEGFRDYTHLKTVIMPNTIIGIYRDCFSGCTELLNVSFSDNLVAIYDRAFEGCNLPIDLMYPQVDDYSFGMQIFKDTNIKSVVIPEHITNIGYGLFENCTSLTNVTFLNRICSINMNAFNNCSNLTDVYYVGTEEEWNTSINELSDKTGNEPLLNATVHYNWTPAMKGELSNYATKAEVGGIETALDNIIAIQNTLIGGGSV